MQLHITFGQIKNYNIQSGILVALLLAVDTKLKKILFIYIDLIQKIKMYTKRKNTIALLLDLFLTAYSYVAQIGFKNKWGGLHQNRQL